MIGFVLVSKYQENYVYSTSSFFFLFPPFLVHAHTAHTYVTQVPIPLMALMQFGSNSQISLGSGGTRKYTFQAR